MKLTERYKLRMPENNEYVSVDDLNYNAGEVDRILKEKADSAGGDISDTNIGTLQNATSEFPVPEAGDSTKVFLGKIRKFIQDFRNWRTGVVLIGQIVNNAVTNNPNLPVSAAVAKGLQDQVTKLNSDLIYKERFFVHEDVNSISYVRGEKIHITDETSLQWREIQAADFRISDGRTLSGLFTDKADIRHYHNTIRGVNDTNRIIGFGHRVTNAFSIPIIFIDGNPMDLIRNSIQENAKINTIEIDWSTNPWRLKVNLYIDGRTYTRYISLSS